MKNFMYEINSIDMAFFHMKEYLGIDIAGLDSELHPASLSHIRMRSLQQKLVGNDWKLLLSQRSPF